MADGNKKLTFLIKKFCTSNNITEETEENISILIHNLLIQHKEYLRIPKNDFKETVKLLFVNYLKMNSSNQEIAINKKENKKEVQDNNSLKATPIKKRKRPQSAVESSEGGDIDVPLVMKDFIN